MKQVTNILVSSLLLIVVFSQYRIGQSNCQTCLRTYSTNCTVCYDHCNANKQMAKCEKYDCTVKDTKGKCLKWNTISLISSSCLNTCCTKFLSNTTAFLIQKFNTCIQKDAASQNDQLNKGLTLSLTLGVVLLLFLAGLLYRLDILSPNDKNFIEGNKNSKIISKFNSKIISGDHLQTSNSNRGLRDDGKWFAQDIIRHNQCSICNIHEINTRAKCQHEFHYNCLRRTIAQTNNYCCPICKWSDGLENIKIYCCKCKQQYQIYNGDQETFFNSANKRMNQIQCQKCQKSQK